MNLIIISLCSRCAQVVNSNQLISDFAASGQMRMPATIPSDCISRTASNLQRQASHGGRVLDSVMGSVFHRKLKRSPVGFCRALNPQSSITQAPAQGPGGVWLVVPGRVPGHPLTYRIV